MSDINPCVILSRVYFVIQCSPSRKNNFFLKTGLPFHSTQFSFNSGDRTLLMGVSFHYFKCYSRWIESFSRKFCICFPPFAGLLWLENDHSARAEDSIWKKEQKREKKMLQVRLRVLFLRKQNQNRPPPERRYHEVS